MKNTEEKENSAQIPNCIELIVDGKHYKEIEEFPNYFIAADGSVYNIKFRRYRNTHTMKSGHKFIKIAGDSGKIKNHYIHRLVAKYWVPNPNNYPIVHHKNKDITDNNASNLEWVSIDEHREYLKTRFNNCKNYLYNGVVYENINEIAEAYNVTERAVYAWRKRGLVTVL